MANVSELDACHIILRYGRYICLQRRDNKPGIWHPGKLHLFGSTVEKGENPANAAIRELSEETSLKPVKSKLRYLWSKDYGATNPHGEWEVGTVHIFEYNLSTDIFEVYEGQGSETISYQEALARKDVTASTREILTDYKQEN